MASMSSMSSPSEKIASFSRGSQPRDRQKARASSPPAIGSFESMRMPVQAVSQSGAFARKPVVP